MSAKIDWDAVERDYRTDKFTLRELGEKYGCSHAAIAKKAKKLDWQKDLTKAIRDATNARMVQAVVNQEVAKGKQAVANVVLAAAEVNVRVLTRHKARTELLVTDVDTARQKLFAVSEGITGLKDAALLTGAVESLVRSTKTLIELERKTYGLDNEGAGDPEDEAPALSGLAAARRIAFALQLGLKEAATQKAKA